jgi:endonuclease/exonuclease/phosphatase (EEP) superfamily protein YafD
VLVENDGWAALSRLIKQTNPDIVALAEVSPAWFQGLQEVAASYPHRVDLGFGFQGLSLWFRERPYLFDMPNLPTLDGSPYLRVSFPFAGSTRHLWLIHPSSPLRRRGRFEGYPELSSLAKRIRENGGSTIVIGDFNSTDGSPYFRDFEAVTGLRDTRLGFGRQSSWPVGFPYQIAIDHAFVSNDLAVTARWRGPSIGSDHRPIIVDLAPSSQAAIRPAANASASAR